MKSKIDREMDRLVKLGILKKALSGYSSPAMAIPRKNSDIPRVVGDFRYLNKRLVKLNMTFPLVRECIQAIGASHVQSYVSNRSQRCISYTEVSPIITTIHRHHTILWSRHLPISLNGYGIEYLTSYMANIH